MEQVEKDDDVFKELSNIYREKWMGAKGKEKIIKNI